MKLFFNILFIALTITGCATPHHYTTFSGTNQLINYPELNVESVAEVGQSMISSARKMVTPAIEINQEITHKEKASGTNGVLGMVACDLTIPAGILPIHMSDEQGTFYRSTQPIRLVTFGADQSHLESGVYIPLDKTKPTQIYYVSYYGNPEKFDHTGLSFKPTNVIDFGKDAFKRELVYSGVSQNTISILYREFQNDMARPAFSQDLKYDLSQDGVIGFRGARFQIIKADNNGIRYKVLKYIE